MINFSKIPFVRILLPFVLGILGNLYLGIRGPSLIIIISLVVFSSLFVFKEKQSKLTIFPFLVVLDIALFLFGTELSKRSQLDARDTYFAKEADLSRQLVWIAQVNDIPVTKPRSVKMDLKVIGLKSDSSYTNVEGNVIAYFQRSNIVNALEPGSFVLIKSELKEVNAPQNPHAFDFRSYLADKNIYHTSYVDSNSFAVIPLQNSFSIWQIGLSIKYAIIKRLGEVELSNNARTICSALITGFDDDIDKEVLDAFSHSGTLHVLSVSGLHVGLIYLVLNYFLGLFEE